MFDTMLHNGYFLLGIAALLPVAVTAVVCCADHRFESRVSYWMRQAVIGVLFGCLAIVGTEWGIRIEGAVVNCRDAAVLCAGLLFGGPAGIIAGIIGGVERFLAVAWGAGEYTQVACTLATIVAGFYAAGVRRFILEGRRPKWAFAFVTGLVMESFHMAMVFLTHIDAMAGAFTVVLACAPTMLLCNSLSVMLATIAATLVSRGSLKRPAAEKTGILNILQSRLLAAIVLAFLLLSPLEYGIQTAVSYTASEQYLAQKLYNAAYLGLSDSSEDATSDSASGSEYLRIGETGFLVCSDAESGTILSGPDALRGKIAVHTGMRETVHVKGLEASEDPSAHSALYEACVDGTDCLCMDTLDGTRRWTAVYPEEEAYADRDWSMVLGTLVQIMLFAAVFVLIDFVMKKLVIGQIRTVNESLGKITAGKLDTVVDARSSLEFAQLSDSANTMVEALQRHTREAQERMAKELELAKAIQLSALPNRFPPYPGRTEFDIFARMETAKEVGGDFYDLYLVQHDRLNFAVADVSGKGVPAALFMMRAKTQIKSLFDGNAMPAQALEEANRNLCEENESNMFVTAWQGSIDLRTGRVCYANAGHNSPVVRRGQGRFEFLSEKHNLALAVFDSTVYKHQELELEPGDIIFLYTDGVTEATDAHGELYGNDRLLACLNSAPFDDMETLCAAVQADIDAFVQDAAQFDDITMLALRYWGSR